MALVINGVSAGGKIKQMTYAEWKTWKASPDYDPDKIVATTDDYVDGSDTMLCFTKAEWEVWKASENYNPDVLVVITDDDTADLINDTAPSYAQAYSSQKIEDALATLQRVYVATEVPADNVGKDGDICIICEATSGTSSGSSSDVPIVEPGTN